MTTDTAMRRLARELNFALTNCLPRVQLSRFMRRFSRIEHPLISAASIWLWRHCSSLDLSDADSSHFPSLHACFVRQLKPGARVFEHDDRWILSPCDTIVGHIGRIEHGTIIQAKRRTYTLEEMLGDTQLAGEMRGGSFATLRITSSMYHRFHAPADLTVNEVIHIPGDTWNVNPATLARVDRLFCKNERAVIRCTLRRCGSPVVLVAVAAVLVSGVRLHCADLPCKSSRRDITRIRCDHPFDCGEEMGWFEHGSTILVFTPAQLACTPLVEEGQIIRAGQRLLQRF